MIRSDEEIFLLQCTGLTSNASSEIDWAVFWELAKSNAVEVAAAKDLQQRGLSDRIPCDIQRQVEETLTRGRMRVQAFSRILEASNQRNLPVCLLKGAAFGATLYGDLCYKRMNDVDILIQPDRWEEFRFILESEGFTTVNELKVGGGEHHTLPWLCPESKTVIGIHWNIAPQRKHPISASDLWRDMEQCSYNELSALTLGPEHNLLHLCVHLPFLKTGLRELSDVCHLLQNREIDWNRFFRLGSEVRAEQQIFRVLSFADSLTPFGLEKILPEKYKKHLSAYLRRETENRCRDLLRSRSTIITAIERWFLLYQCAQQHKERSLAFKGVWSSLFSDSVPLYGERMQMRPFGLMRVLAYEHGWKKVLLGLTGMSLHQLAGLVLPEKQSAMSLLENPTYQIFWELD